MSFSTTLSKPRAFHMPIPKDKAPTSQVMLYPVLKADELLLADPKRRYFLSKISQYTGLETPLYQTLYETAMVRLAELVQALPYQTGGLPGGLMDYSLERAVAIIRHYHESAGADFSPLYAYALFTAALFQDMGKIISQQAVMISDAEGKFVAEWSPFEGSLLAVKAQYYKLRHFDDRWIQLGQFAAPLLARQCIPEPGFEWIASDPKIFSLWMGVFTGEKEQAGEFLLQLQLSVKLISLLTKKDRLAELTIHPTRPPQTAMGEDFAAWLSAGLKDGTIPINTPNAHVHGLAQGGLLLEPRLFQQFCDVYGRSVGWAVVCKQFNMLGFTKLSGEDLEFEKFFSKTPESIANESAARNPKPGGFFNAGTVAIAAMVREGLIVLKPELLYGNREAAEFSNFTSTSYVAPTRSVASVQAKAEQWARKYSIKKPFLEI